MPGDRRGDRSPPQRRRCVGKPSRSVRQRCIEKIELAGSEGVLENSRALGIARRGRKAFAGRNLQRSILRIEEEGAWSARPGPANQNLDPDRDLQGPKYPVQQEARRPVDTIAERKSNVSRRDSPCLHDQRRAARDVAYPATSGFSSLRAVDGSPRRF